MQQAQTFETQSTATDGLFTTLAADLGNFTATFGSFAEAQKLQDNQAIIDLGNEIDQLNLDIDKSVSTLLFLCFLLS
jgi:hypothetical protein